MKRFTIITIALMVLTAAAAHGQVPETISYQGVLTDGAGTPVLDGSYDITFNIYTVASGGTAVWTETQSVGVAGGIFSAILGAVNPLTIPFDTACWLGVAVDGGAEFAPRRELTASAYSLNARGVEDSVITANKIAVGTVVRSLNAFTDDVTLAAGANVTITTANDSIVVSAAGGPATPGWNLTGNAGTTPGTHFVGTTDATNLETRVNGERAYLIEPRGLTPNLIGGYRVNRVIGGAVGATIAGGGGDGVSFNQITDDWCFIGGGSNNAAGDNAGTADDKHYAVVGGGFQNKASGAYSIVVGGLSNQSPGDYSFIGGGNLNQAMQTLATIGGGYDNSAGSRATVGGGWANSANANMATIGGGNANTASGTYATIAGGSGNRASQDADAVVGGENNLASGGASFVGGGVADTASGLWSVVVGGQENRASHSYSTVIGGAQNTASGIVSTVLGGGQNHAGGAYSVAAGRRAMIADNHGGTFLFADANLFDFNSATHDEFAVRATGGVRFVSAIDGGGNPTAGVVLPAGGGAWSPLSDRNAKENFVLVDGVAVLERLDAMEISTWNYKAQDEGIRHMGPMAQDFHAAFAVGEDEKRISTVDADGVALAAIQGLKRLADEKDARIAALERRIAELERTMTLLVNERGGVAVASDGEASAR